MGSAHFLDEPDHPGDTILDVVQHAERKRQKEHAAMVAALIFAFGVFLYQAIQRRRVLAEANAVLEERVAMRTQALSDTNVQLRREIGERQEAEAAARGPRLRGRCAVHRH